MKLKDYPLRGVLVKNYNETIPVAKSLVPEEWFDYEIIHTYVDERLSMRVLVVKEEET